MSLKTLGTVSNLIKLIQKEVSQVANKQGSFKDKIKSIIKDEQ